MPVAPVTVMPSVMTVVVIAVVFLGVMNGVVHHRVGDVAAAGCSKECKAAREN